MSSAPPCLDVFSQSSSSWVLILLSACFHVPWASFSCFNQDHSSLRSIPHERFQSVDKIWLSAPQVGLQKALGRPTMGKTPGLFQPYLTSLILWALPPFLKMVKHGTQHGKANFNTWWVPQQSHFASQALCRCHGKVIVPVSCTCCNDPGTFNLDATPADLQASLP